MELLGKCGRLLVNALVCQKICVSFLKKVEINIVMLVTYGRVVTSSRQITEVKQRRARLVLGWVTARCSSHAPAMCRGVGQASHITLPLSTQQ